MSIWWASLTGPEHVFYIIAFASTLFLVIQLLLNLIGLAGHDIDADASAGADIPHDVSLDHVDAAHHTGLAFISVRTVVAFFVGFGWAGVVMLSSKVSLPLTALFAFFIGLVFLVTIYYLMKAIFKLSETGNIDFKNAIGQSGTVYIPIPARGQGTGQVQVVVQGRLRELPAVTEEEAALPSGTPIKVTDIMGDSTMVVRKLEVK